VYGLMVTGGLQGLLWTSALVRIPPALSLCMGKQPRDIWEGDTKWVGHESRAKAGQFSRGGLLIGVEMVVVMEIQN